MPDNPNVPSTWYKYDFPLKENDKLPKPSNADYSPQNIAPLIEFFSGILGYSTSQLGLLYENNYPEDRSKEILVFHPNDGIYSNNSKEKSYELLRYEMAAKKSNILKNFEENSPAKITYFDE